jgi:hypothetical protein
MYSPAPAKPVSVVKDPIIVIQSALPSEVICPHCRLPIITRVEKRAGTTAWILCLILCCFCFPFCIYPLICDPCMDAYHICPNCNRVIYVKNP